MRREEILDLCARWLPRWTGNRPDELIDIYHEDVFYRDPARPDGLRGRAEVLPYFRKLLATFPDWVWEADDVVMLEPGAGLPPGDAAFALKWTARIPIGGTGKVVVERGVDLVVVKDGRIFHNEVHFDRSALLAALGR